MGWMVRDLLRPGLTSGTTHHYRVRQTQSPNCIISLFVCLFFVNIYLATLGLSYSMPTLSCSTWDLVP